MTNKVNDDQAAQIEDTGMRLVILSGKFSGKKFPVQEGSNLVGRWDPERTAYPEIDLDEFDEDAKVSRKHAVIVRSGAKATLEDVGSLNGTYINKTQKLEPNVRYELKPGVELMVGRIVMRFEVD